MDIQDIDRSYSIIRNVLTPYMDHEIRETVKSYNDQVAVL